MIETLSSARVESFQRDGFLIVEEGLVSERALELLRERYVPLFDGEDETAIRADEVNWIPGRDPDDRTRQLCNAWKSDTVVAAQVLSERTGRLAAQLAGYSGVRILQDDVPVGTRFHETNADVTHSRYRRRGDLSLDESFFPVVWDESGYGTPWLAEPPALD